MAPKLFGVKVKKCKMVCKDPATFYIPSFIPATFSLAPPPPVTLTAPIKMCNTLTLVLPLIAAELTPSLPQFCPDTFSVKSLPPLLHLVNCHHSGTLDMPSLLYFPSLNF